MNLYLTLDAFPEVPAMLERLKAAGLKTAILSNGSPKMLEAAVKGAKVGHLLDAVLSVEAVGVYKPHPKVYQLAVDRLGSSPRPSHSSRPMPGTHTQPRPSACAWFGATVMVSGPSACRASRTAKSNRWPSC